MNAVKVGQVRRFIEMDNRPRDYTVKEIFDRNGVSWVVLAMLGGGDYHEWPLYMVEDDELVTDVTVPDPKNPQVGDRFHIFEHPDRTYEVLEVGESTVRVRYSTEAVWPTDYCEKDVPL